MKYYKYVVLGGGIAALSAVKAIRERDRTSVILMISSEAVPCYSRPMLTKIPLPHYDVRNTFIEPVSWYENNGIDLLLSTDVISLDTSSESVVTDNGSFHYEKCIYALGAYNFIPPFKGKDLRNVFSLRTDRDLMAIRRGALKAEHAAIIGGGVIGLEAAFMLKDEGLDVTVIETAPFLMPRLLDEESSRYLQNRLNGINVITGAKVLGFSGSEVPRSVELEGADPVPAQLILISCGVRANTSIAANAGVSIGRAIIVDDHMRTNIPGILACGDCAEFNGMNTALWTQAVAEGQVAGANAAGGDEVYRGSDMALMLEAPSFSLYSDGDMGKKPGVSYTQTCTYGKLEPRFSINRKPEDLYERDFFIDGKMVGTFMLGNLRDMKKRKKEIFGQ
ncbi:MAG: NAD(P)/FAD-dependent oxidoreductase [Spirochaetales bacterium]|nr:NAD(P)/FAD-dependent oxidoreductase [Spirochaetales bacterium]